MFGYIRPLKPELKVKDFDKFKACYCSLCHTLGKEYGLPARFILNYDFTFMAMLLWSGGEPVRECSHRCPVSPFKRRCMVCPSDSLSKSAGYSLILAWWKLKDTAEDESFFKALGARLAMLGLYFSYKKAKRLWSGFDTAVERSISDLSALESEGCESVDKTADCFAGLLAAGAVGEGGARERIFSQLLYHMGRWIYIIDAVNDMDEDLRGGKYNPLAARYGVTDSLTDDQKNDLRVTLNHSLNLMISAYGLLDRSQWSDIIDNIIYLGMPAVTDAVFAGVFNIKQSKGLHRLENN